MEGNSSNEKIYPMNVDGPSREPEKESTPDESSPKPRSTVAAKLIICAVLIGICAIFLTLLFENRTVKYSGSSLPAVCEKNEIALPLNPIDESEIPEWYIVSLPLYDFSLPTPESEKVNVDYFNDTVFIGDSRTQGLLMYTSLKPKYNFSAQGATTLSVRTKSYIPIVSDTEDGERTSCSLEEALENALGNYKSIYISLGINELGWNPDIFIDSYKSLILTIREITDVPIYVQLILPVTAQYAENSPYGVTNDKQAAFNTRLVELAKEMELFYLDPTGVFTLEDGSLDPSSTFDGAHMTPKAYEYILEYYCTHTVDISSYSNTLSDKNN